MTNDVCPQPAGSGPASPAYLAIAAAYNKYAMQSLTETEQTSYCLDGEGYAKPPGGSLSVSRVNGVAKNSAYYYLSVMGEVGHHIRVHLEGSDGYHKNWDGYGSIWTDQIHSEEARTGLGSHHTLFPFRIPLF